MSSRPIHSEQCGGIRSCPHCGHEGTGFSRQYYPDSGLAPDTICPECGRGF